MGTSERAFWTRAPVFARLREIDTGGVRHHACGPDSLQPLGGCGDRIGKCLQACANLRDHLIRAQALRRGNLKKSQDK